MWKLEVYIETSVWSFAFAKDVPNYRADTLDFFDRCRAGQYETCVSTVVLDEIKRAEEPLQSKLIDLIHEIRPDVLDVSPEAEQLAEAFVHEGAVPRNKPEDARHVAVAISEEVDVLVSWNFRHIANVRRVERFNAVAVLLGYYRPIRIVSPAEVLYDELFEIE